MSALTPNKLLDLAIDFDEQRKMTENAYDLRRKSDDALNCAIWMENQGILESPMIGPFGNVNLREGDTVKIKKGAIVHGNGDKAAQKTYAVTVFRVDQGWVSDPLFTPDHRITVRHQMIHWAGAGGYWRWTEATNVIIGE